MRRTAALLLALIFFASCVRGPKAAAPGVQIAGSQGSPGNRREVEMGRQIHQAIVSSFRVYTEPRVVGYVNRVARSIARRADRQDLTYQVTLLYDDRVYANEAPGGYIYITTGFLNFLQNESELAGVLAHGVGELQFRDPRLSKAPGVMRALAQTGAVVAPFLGQIGILAATGLVLLNAVSESRIPSPEKRVQISDERALQYLTGARQDPQGYLDVLGRFLSLGRDWSPYCYDYLASRPVSLERYQKVLEAFDKLSLEGQRFNVHRDRFLEITKGAREIYQR